VCYFSGEGIAVILLGIRRDVQFEILISMYSFPSIGRPAPFRVGVKESKFNFKLYFTRLRRDEGDCEIILYLHTIKSFYHRSHPK